MSCGQQIAPAGFLLAWAPVLASQWGERYIVKAQKHHRGDFQNYMRAPSKHTSDQMGQAVVALGRAIAFEWSWRAEAGNSTELRLRGIILGSVKSVRNSRHWHGCAGDRPSGPIQSAADARQWVERQVIEMLIAALELKTSSTLNGPTKMGRDTRGFRTVRGVDGAF